MEREGLSRCVPDLKLAFHPVVGRELVDHRLPPSTMTLLTHSSSLPEYARLGQKGTLFGKSFEPAIAHGSHTPPRDPDPSEEEDADGRKMESSYPEARVLVILTGGTMCMKPSQDGLVPAPGFLEHGMRPLPCFNDGSNPGR